MKPPACIYCKSGTTISVVYEGGIYVFRCANDHLTQVRR
jgi:hypothetical protein